MNPATRQLTRKLIRRGEERDERLRKWRESQLAKLRIELASYQLVAEEEYDGLPDDRHPIGFS